MPGAAELNKQAVDLYKAHDLTGAEALYRQALEADNYYFPAQLNLGILMFKMGRFDEAIRDCTRAVSLNPNHPSAHFHLGNAYYAKMWWEEAFVEYERVLGLDPGHVDVHFAIGGIFLNRGHKERAVECWKKYLSLTNVETPKTQLAKTYITDAVANKVTIGKYIAE
jgi:tetratricopeptide (TPR) repeat protein